MGKQLQQIINMGLKNGYLKLDSSKIGDLTNLNDKDCVVLISDEKEKPFANLERIIKGYDKYIKLTDTDTIFLTEASYPGI